MTTKFISKKIELDLTKNSHVLIVLNVFIPILYSYIYRLTENILILLELSIPNAFTYIVAAFINIYCLLIALEGDAKTSTLSIIMVILNILSLFLLGSVSFVVAVPQIPLLYNNIIVYF